MSDNPAFENKDLLSAALDRARKQFPEFDPQHVVSVVGQQHEERMNARPVVQGPMRDLR